MRYVYLAGQITGLTHDEAQDWRDAARLELRRHGLAGISPMRGQGALREHGVLTATVDHHGDAMTTPRAIMRRDHYDCHRANVVIANVRGMDRISAGTSMEIAWAYHAHIPVILVMEEGGAHDHVMINEAVSYRVDTVAEAIAVAVAMLGEYGC